MQALTSGSIVPATWQAAGHDHWWIGVCPSCRNGVLVHEISLPGVQPYTFYPAALLSPTDERIPPEIRRDLEEAKRCFSVQAYRACAVMARRAMQGACIEQGATQEKLVAQLHELAARHVITDSLKPWGDAVRWVGNDAAHPNGEDVAEEDAEDILSLAEQFMPVVYVASAIAKDIETKRHR
ncbi:MAG TPA: DUF4145 domain-containing protein [Ktedonobacterales bacterium]